MTMIIIGLVRLKKCRGTETKHSCSNSGSDLGKVSVPAPDSNPDPDHIKHSFQIKNVLQNFAFLMLLAALFDNQIFRFLDFLFL
jgi:hypothetical protein